MILEVFSNPNDSMKFTKFKIYYKGFLINESNKKYRENTI